MHIAILTLHMRLEGCQSLKEKRQRLNGLRDRFGRHTGIAVCESDLQDSRREAEWGFVAAATSRNAVQNMLDSVEKYVQESVDAQVLDRQREIL